MTIGQRVKKLRIEKGLTQNELAQKLGYKSKTSVAHIENGRDIPRAMVVTLSDILDTTPAYLMGWEDEKSAPAETGESENKEFIEEYNKLSESERADVRRYIAFLVSERGSDQ